MGSDNYAVSDDYYNKFTNYCGMLKNDHGSIMSRITSGQDERTLFKLPLFISVTFTVIKWNAKQKKLNITKRLQIISHDKNSKKPCQPEQISDVGKL